MSYDFDYEQMLKGELYMASGIHKEHHHSIGKKLAQKFNETKDKKTRNEIIQELFKKADNTTYIEPPLYVDYGFHTSVGKNFFANMDCIFLDVNKITIGDNVMLAPRVGLYTAGHPTDPTIRNEGLEFGLPITIEDNVWVGANAVILPGITIGKNAIVAAGAVVTKDVPANTIVGGNPAKVIREITQADTEKWNAMKENYFKAKNNS